MSPFPFPFHHPQAIIDALLFMLRTCPDMVSTRKELVMMHRGVVACPVGVWISVRCIGGTDYMMGIVGWFHFLVCAVHPRGSLGKHTEDKAGDKNKGYSLL